MRRDTKVSFNDNFFYAAAVQKGFANITVTYRGIDFKNSGRTQSIRITITKQEA